ncbi:MnhB domain-containing protein [candidate division KSB1 bacterium]
MSTIVKMVTRFLIGPIFLFGCYITIYGHLTPGGGFAGGVILACGFVLMTLAFSKKLPLSKIPTSVLHFLDSMGGFLFLFMALIGIYYAVFFFNFLDKGTPFKLLSSGTILIGNILIGIKVFATVFGIFLALTLFGRFTLKVSDQIKKEKEFKDSTSLKEEKVI